MLQPLQIFQQVQQGQVPSTWHVYRPLYGPGRSLQRAGTIVMGIYLGMMILIISTGLMALFLYRLIGSNPFERPSLVLPMMLIALSLAIVIPIGTTTYAKQKSDALLILLPEGVVSCERCSNEARRSFATIDYTQVKFLWLKVINGRYGNTFWLDMEYRDQTRGSLKIDWRFGDPEKIAQRIIAEHALYTASTPPS